MFPCAAVSGGVQPARPRAVGTMMTPLKTMSHCNLFLRDDLGFGQLHPCLHPFAFTQNVRWGGEDMLTLSRHKCSLCLSAWDPSGSFLCHATCPGRRHSVNVFGAPKRSSNGPPLGGCSAAQMCPRVWVALGRKGALISPAPGTCGTARCWFP